MFERAVKPQAVEPQASWMNDHLPGLMVLLAFAQLLTFIIIYVVS